MRAVILFLSIILLLISSGTYTQNKIWTLEECMKYSVENNPKVNKQIATNNIYEHNYTKSIGNFIPSLNAGTGINLNFGRGLDPETNTYTNINVFSNNYSIYSSLDIFQGLSRVNDLRIKKINRLIGKEQLEEIKDMAAYETMQAYMNVLYIEDIYKLAELQLNESQKSLEQVRKMENLGIKSSPDVAEFAAKEASDNYNLTIQKNALSIAIITLKEKMNYPLEETLEISDHEISQLIQKNNETATEIYQQSLTSYPKILSAEYSLRSSKLAYDISRGNLFPRISMEGGFSTGFSRYMDGENAFDPFKEQMKNRQGYYLGFSLSVPIFNGFYYSSNIKISKQEYIIAQNQRDEILYSVYAEIEQAVADMNGQADAYTQAKKQAEAMMLAHSANQKKYDEGLISAIEFTTSSNRLLSAQIEEINAKYMFWLKYKLVRYYKGENFLNEK